MRRKTELNGVAVHTIESTINTVSVDRMRLFRCLALKVNSPTAAARMLAKLRKVAPQPIDGGGWVRIYPSRD